MNYRVIFNKQFYQISQEFINFYDLCDQLKMVIPQCPDLPSISYRGADNTKMVITNQGDLEALEYLDNHNQFVTLEIIDLNQDIFNLALQKNETNMMAQQKQQGTDVSETSPPHVNPNYKQQAFSGGNFSLKSQQQISSQNAICIEQIFGVKYQDAYNFVLQNPTLNQDQLIDLALQLKNS